MKKPRKEITDWNKFRDQFVRWTLRRASFRWPPRGEAMKAARVDRGLYKCAGCGSLYKTKEVRVDHIEPVVEVTAPMGVQGLQERPNSGVDLGKYVLRMFPEANGFQVLCTQCHHTKTQGENSARREAKRRIK